MIISENQKGNFTSIFIHRSWVIMKLHCWMCVYMRWTEYNRHVYDRTKRKKAHTNSDNSNNTNEIRGKKNQQNHEAALGNSNWAIARAHFLFVRISMYCVSIVGVVVRVLCNRRAHTFNSSNTGNNSNSSSSNSTKQRDGAYEVLVGFASFRFVFFDSNVCVLLEMLLPQRDGICMRLCVMYLS